MDILGNNRLALFIVFVVPGFIAIKVYDLLSPSSQIDSSKQLIDAVSYSCLNYAILIWPIFLIESEGVKASHPQLYILFYMVVLFFSPVLLATGWKFLREIEWIQKFVPHPTQKPWDYVFSQRKTYWVIVTLKNGEKIAGMYGPESFASSAPSEEQIYLEEQWILNHEGGFDRPAEQTSGIIILSSEIRSVEFIHSGDDDDEQ